MTNGRQAFVFRCLSLVQISSDGIVDRHGSRILKSMNILEPAACFLSTSIRRLIFLPDNFRSICHEIDNSKLLSEVSIIHYSDPVMDNQSDQFTPLLTLCQLGWTPPPPTTFRIDDGWLSKEFPPKGEFFFLFLHVSWPCV